MFVELVTERTNLDVESRKLTSLSTAKFWG